MGSTRRRTAGLAFALLGCGLFASAALAGQASTQGATAQAAAAAQRERPQAGREGVMNSKAGSDERSRTTFEPGARSKATAGTTTTAVVDATPPPATTSPSAPAPAPSPRPVPAPVPVPAPAPVPVPAPAPPVTAPPPGLSDTAPDTPPSVGVVTPGGSSSGSSPSATPEPSTLLLMGTGLAALYRLRRRQ